MPARVKALDIRPVTGSMDARSAPDELELNGYRYIQNFGVTVKNRLCRITGFDRHLTRDDYNNQDLHDQLLSLTGQAEREPVTFLFEATSTRKSTKIYAGTSRVLYALNNATGNWKVISDQLGGDGLRWSAAQLLDTILFTNNNDAIVYHQFDQGATEDDSQSVAEIPDLRDTIKLTQAGVVVVWRDTVFLMNVVVDGTVKSNGIYWSNYQKALDWLPGADSTAGNRDLDSGETIMAAVPLANRLLVYTNKGIWEGASVGGDVVFSFTRRFSPRDGENCLFYPNTLISTGDRHLYAGVDGIYAYDLFKEKPERVEWIHRASSVMFEEIKRSDCFVHVAGFNTEKKEIYFSYAQNGDDLPSSTLVVNTEYPHAYVMDCGFSAFVTYTLKEPVQSLRTFLLERCICTDEELTTYWDQFEKEGQFCTEQAEEDCPTPPQSIYTQTAQTISYMGETVETEDWEAEEADADSLCAQLDGLTINGLCETEGRVDECNSGKRFVAASSDDYCLKEFADVYYREICIGFTGCGSYSRRGYRSIARSGPISGGIYEDDKEISRFEVEATSGVQATASEWKLRIGVHSQAIDPNDDQCGIVWDEQDRKDIACLSDSAAVSRQNKTLPSESYEWPLFYQGRYLYFELSVENPAANPVDTGGQCCISRLTIDLRPVRRDWL